MSLRDFVKKGKFDAISVEEFGAVLQMLSDPELGDRAMEAARRLIERSSGKDSVALANTLITFISAKSLRASTAGPLSLSSSSREVITLTA